MKTISIIIPVYNEEKTIKELLNRIINLKTGLKKEIIAVDDGSKDNSHSVLEKFKGIKLISHRFNRGKGAAVRTGLSHSTGDIILIQDADLEYPPEQIPNLLAPILQNKADVVFGSRFLKKENEKWKIFSHYLGNRLISFFANLLYGKNLTDIETCYKIFTKKVKDSLDLRLNDFGFEVEFFANVCAKNYRIAELPIEYKPRVWAEGKKINWRDGVKAIWYLLKMKFKN